MTKRVRAPRFHDREVFEPDTEWMKQVKALADRYGESYGVRRQDGVFVLEFAKPGVDYALTVTPTKNNK